MRKNAVSIPINKFGDDFSVGISIERISFESLPDLGEWEQPERHDRHSFFLLEKGSVTMEIDFQLFEIQSPSIIYMHPDQVHRILAFENVSVCAWAAKNENLNPEYLKLLDDITPTAPMRLEQERFELLSDAASLCIKFAERKKDQLYHSLLKDNSNVLVGLVISIFQESFTPADKLSRSRIRYQSLSGSFSSSFYTAQASPAEYAEKLHLSTPYLNECVKNSTGHPVSYHIQQRIILEAKRLLYHSDRSLKEIAAILGYDDYPYFSRLFTKVAGVSPIVFRNKNLD